jgi:hypothetical protein
VFQIIEAMTFPIDQTDGFVIFGGRESARFHFVSTIDPKHQWCPSESGPNNFEKFAVRC